MSIYKIRRTLHLARNTVRRYLSGAPEMICVQHRTAAQPRCYLDTHRERIRDELARGTSMPTILAHLQADGIHATYTTLRVYCKKMERCESGSAPFAVPAQLILRRGQVAHYLWTGEGLDGDVVERMYTVYPGLYPLRDCIRTFRWVLDQQSIPGLHIFIERYGRCDHGPIRSFAAGLLLDLEAIENAVASPLNNAFLEGNVNRLKLIKRSMYGRAKLPLLAAKVRLCAAYV